MIAADRPNRRGGRLLSVSADGGLQHLSRSELAILFGANDLIVANDAAVLPASLTGSHVPSGKSLEVRLAGWPQDGRPGVRFIALAFGAGDYQMPTEYRRPPPSLQPGDRLELGPLPASIERLAGHPRLPIIRFEGDMHAVWTGFASHGRPVQYAHVPEPLALWDVWTNLAARPVALEPPSAGLPLTWRMVSEWRRRGAELVTLTHAAGLSSTGDPALDLKLPFDEPFSIPERTAAAVNRAKARGRRIVAIGTTVVRALEAARSTDETISAGNGTARGRIGPSTELRVVDALLTGMHQPGESHYQLLGAFAGPRMLARITHNAEACGYRTHEFGDSMLIERQSNCVPAPESGTLSQDHVCV